MMQQSLPLLCCWIIPAAAAIGVAVLPNGRLVIGKACELLPAPFIFAVDAVKGVVLPLVVLPKGGELLGKAYRCYRLD